MNERPRKHIFRMIARIVYLFFIKPADCQRLVKKSYDHISDNYDQAWTRHIRNLTESLISRLNPKQGDTAIDLTCGTGFSTRLIAEKTNNIVVGVDSSEGMLTQARKNCDNNCVFIQADILEYLKKQSSSSVDIVTCCWGLGYLKPFAVLRQIKRILKPGGKAAIIDNSLFSLREIIYCSFLTFAEQPEKLHNLMRFKFLPGASVLRIMLRLLNLKTSYSANGSQSYTVESGQAAICKLRATGAAAGFEYACDEEEQEQVFKRFAEIIEEKYMTPRGITVIHRYLVGIAQK
jgi:ubiquinone/menaquinone biosynthesis C-methylase UbiE